MFRADRFRTRAGFGRALVSGTALGVALAALTSLSASAMESRSYVMWWFAQASYSQDGDCGPGGINPKMTEQFAPDLKRLGYTGAQIEELMKSNKGGGDEEDGGGGWEKQTMRQIMNTRARVNGEPANAFMHPAAVADPHLKWVTGKYAYGFDLDGRADGPMAFEDPQTHEKGVDNQLFRALGCVEAYRGTLQNDNTFWSFMWMSQKDTTPAWLITITGEDLNKDGPVTISMTRALEPPRYNGGGDPRADMTFREDGDPRIRGNIFKGQIAGGVVTITEKDANLHLMQDQLTYPEFDLSKFHVRLTMGADGSLDGLLAGYQPIDQIYFAIGQAGMIREGTGLAPELPGIYHLLRKMADGKPDPKTGMVLSISSTYHLKSVPAFVVPAKEMVDARQRFAKDAAANTPAGRQ
jgi:hypothetical protein